MYSRFLILLFALSSCSLKLNEEVTKPTVVVNPVQGGCLSGAAVTMDQYFQGKISEHELEAFWNCMDKALVSFISNTRGADGKNWKGEELSSFLSTYFLKGKRIDPELVKEAMLLKQGMLGGNASVITKEEIEQTILFVRALKSTSLKLRPHMPIKTNNYLEKKYSVEQLNEVLFLFQTGMAEIGSTLAGKQGSYSFDQLNHFLVRLKVFLYEGNSGKGEWIDSAQNWTQALRPAKQIFISPPKDQIRSEDWSKIYELAPKYYSLYLKSKFFLGIEDQQFSSGNGLKQLEALFQEFSSIMLTLLKNHPTGEISSSDVEEFLEALHKNNLLPVQLETAKAFFQTLFSKILSGPQSTRGYVINKETLARLHFSFRFATDGFKMLEALFRVEGLDLATGHLAEEKIPSIEKLIALVPDADATTKDAAELIHKSMKEIRTIFRENSSQVLISEKRGSARFSHSHLVKMHMFQSVNRLLAKSYGSKPGILQEAEINALADDIFPLLQDLSLVAKETRNSVSKRLFEASLFLYSSDGQTSLTMTEAAELQALLLSTLSHGKNIHKKLAERSGVLDAESPSKSVIPARDYPERLLELRSEVWANIPGFLKFVDSRKKPQQLDLLKKMFQFLRKGRENQDFTIADTQSVILLPYYIELLFSRFDLDEDGFLTNEEAERAFPVFQPFLSKKAKEHGLDSAEDHHAVYMFLLAYQELPNNMKTKWIWRRYITGEKNFSVDRAKVVQIFEKLLK